MHVLQFVPKDSTTMPNEQPGSAANPERGARSPSAIAEERIAQWEHDPFPHAEDHRTHLEKAFGSRTRTLDLEGLRLLRVPNAVRGLRGLESVSLARNYIQELPPWIGELSEVKGINLDGNRLQVVPESIRSLRQLRVLWLSNNRLVGLPTALADLPLQELRLDGNPNLDLPEGILSAHPQEVLRYYFESRADDGQPLRELKLLLVGRGKAGKTTLVKRLAGLEPDRNEPETHSIAIRQLTLSCSRGQVHTRAWDFGGQEILHSTHQFFLTERSLYLLVLEPRTGLAQRDAEYWLKLVETLGGGSPTIVALNWHQQQSWRVDEVKLRRKFPFIVDFIPTDALYGKGINELRAAILKTVEGIKDVWMPFPKRWREIKNAVAGMRGNFLTYEKYADLCSEFGEDRAEAQADLAGILNSLGLALYFGKDPRLHDTRVLNPSWVTGGVYAVIRSPSVLESHGQLAAADMARVLAEAENHGLLKRTEYPQETHGFILELMRAFQLCYASEDVRGRPKRYLVPERLPEFEPKMEENWEKAPVRLRYRYEVMPPGFLPRFIVRTHALSEGAPHWRHGVVLRHANAQALVSEEFDPPELQLFAPDGDPEVRQFLVAMVRRELQTLHSEMKMQPVEELELTGDSGQWISVRSLREVELPSTPVQKLPVQPEGTANVNVSLELDKIFPNEVRAMERDPFSVPIPVRLFVSYAHEDERQLKRLDSMLDILEQHHGLASWRDKRLIAGEEWDEEIRRRLEEMDIFLFVASQTSLVRPYIRDPELRRARERSELGEVSIVSVKLEPCASDEDPVLGKLQRLARKTKSIAETPLKSLAWEQVRKDLLPVIDRVRQRKMRSVLK